MNRRKLLKRAWIGLLALRGIGSLPPAEAAVEEGVVRDSLVVSRYDYELHASGGFCVPVSYEYPLPVRPVGTRTILEALPSYKVEREPGP